jgi:subtilisin family serine protease
VAVAIAAGLIAWSEAPWAMTSASAATFSGDQWGLSMIGAPTAWQYGTGSGVRIGIVDSGVDLNHEDLQGKVVAAADFLSNPGCPPPSAVGQDDNGHGTHVAGIAAASGAVGVDGVAPAASLVVAKVLDCQGSGEISDVENGIAWAVQHGARVINLSLAESLVGGLGLVDPTQVGGNPLAQSLQAAWNAGVIPVVAAGNNSDGIFGLGDEDYSNVPAVVVAAAGPSGRLASYSNQVTQAEWGVIAPGGDDTNGPTTPTCGSYDPAEILSTYWTAQSPDACYATDEGTSMATPFVTGTLALLLGRGLTPSQAVQTLLSTANHGVSCGSDCSGMVSAAAAMSATVSRASSGSAQNGNATPTSVAPSPRPSSGSNAVRSAGAPPSTQSTTATPSTTSTTSEATSTTAPERSSAAAGHHLRASGDGAWWVLLPVLAGLGAVAALFVNGRRRWAIRHGSSAARGNSAGHEDPPTLPPV